MNQQTSKSDAWGYVIVGAAVVAIVIGGYFALRSYFETEPPVRPSQREAAAPIATALPTTSTSSTTTTSTSTTTTTVAQLPFEAGPCVVEVPVEVAAECGLLPVPEDRTDPGTEHLRLAVMTILTPGGATHPDPIVYLDGGPGGPGIHPLDLEAWSEVARVTQRDVVLFSQRGTVFSEPDLGCDDLDFFLVKSVEDCRARLVEQGRNLAAYTSATSATDLAELRTALGYEEWNLLGISYGSRLALTALRDHPRGIRTVILEGVYPPQVDGYGESAKNDLAVLDRLFRACERDPVCDDRHPDLQVKLESVVATLNEKPAILELVDPATGEEAAQFVDGFVFLYEVVGLLADRVAYREVPAIITAAETGDYERLFEASSPYLPGAGHAADTEPVEATRSFPMSLSVQCAEEAPFSVVLIGEGLLERVLSELALFELELCDVWSVPRADERENQPVQADIPALLLTGDLDNITPLEWALRASLTLPRSFHFTFPGYGHGFSISSPCALAMMRAFLDEPSAEPDAACIESAPPAAFAER